jgi:class 3 adenylate cyclase/tetratricopeptide (TPR) repeat protein
MDFVAVVDQAIALLRQRGRLTYRTLQLQFQLDEAHLAALKDELIEGQRLAADEDGRVLVWTGEHASASVPASALGTPACAASPLTEPARAPLAYTPSYLAEKILTSRSALEGERKQVTVLFADLKGSMELLADRDPEEARQLLDPVLERMMAAVHRYEGTVNQVMGDGIMALFGAPLAHEDHAVRACYAALRMQEAVKQYAVEVQRTRGVPLHIRVGLNAGEVVVRSIGSDLHMDYTAVGQTTHLAARMEQMAMPGAILITPAVLGLVEGFVQVQTLGAMPVRGLREPLEVYEVTGASVVRSRLQVAAARGLTRFVGRQPELETLQQALAQAQVGHGQVVALVGDAGVGKSRLVYEVVHAHLIQGGQVLESAAVSYGQGTPYLPVINLLKRYCHVEERDDARTIRAKVTGQLLTLDEALHETIPALLWLLEALPEDHPFLTLEPPQRRRRALDALKRVLVRESQRQPLLLVFEDLHWMDTETQALLNSLVESLPTTQMLLLVNYRPEYEHGWVSKTSYTQLRLDPLPLASAEDFLHALLGDAPSLAPLTQLLIARTQGNPFFLEESVRTLVETGVLVGTPGAYGLAQALPTIQVPATVQAVLAARIDRLPPEDKRLLQTAAVLGTEVPVPLLHAIAELPEEGLQHGLARLQAAEFLYETRLFPERELTFTHALTREVAYSSLLRERRRGLHAHIVAALEALAGDRVAEQIDRLAHHALRGEVWDKALAYCRQAGEKARARSAHREAAQCFEQALSVLPQLPETRETLAHAIDLRLDLEGVLTPLGELRRILDHLQQAQAIAEVLHDAHRLGRIAAQLTFCHWWLGNAEAAIEAGEHALATVLATGDVRLALLTNYRLSQVYFHLAAYGRAIDICRRAIALATGDLARERLGLPALPAVYCRTYLGWSLGARGEFTEGRSTAAEAIAWAASADNSYDSAFAHWGAGFLALQQGHLEEAITLLERSLALCQRGSLLNLVAVVAGPLGEAYALAGRLGDALGILEDATQQSASMNIMNVHQRNLMYLGHAHLLAGHPTAARQRGEEALALARAQRQRGGEAHALQLLGEIIAQGDPAEVGPAEASYRQALALAEELDMRPLQAHCHRSLGTLYATTGQREQAHTALLTAIDLYRAMDMTFWLPEAEAALAQVEGQ